MADNQDTSHVDPSEVLELLKELPLSEGEKRQSLRPAAQYFHQKTVDIVGKGWGIRTGRMHREGVKLQLAGKSDKYGDVSYRIYYSKKSSRIKGTPDYMAPTFVARFLEGGVKPHYTAKGATIKKQQRGQLSLNRYQQKLKHPGFPARPINQETQKREAENTSNIARNNLMKILKKKGVQE
ncbi:putative tail completion protein [Serratia phage vB_SmaS_Stoker]|uniref:Tail completion protein n=1 Tax=Serratia phage vB_SmaS_Stoker TaxID=2902692 RepID=A0AC61TRT3_9CAUD|nr:putative tail completion protein [Serratia phage vB_SmaS_Stoker]UGO53763.1 putative tail completion protein [Serratia phage vB_SmaS_Stoker]